MMKLENLNPYSEIKKVPLYGGSNIQSSAWSVHLNDNMNVGKPWHEVGIVGKDYLLVTNKEIVEMVEEVIKVSDLNLEKDKISIFTKKRRHLQSSEKIEMPSSHLWRLELWFAAV